MSGSAGCGKDIWQGMVQGRQWVFHAAGLSDILLDMNGARHSAQVASSLTVETPIVVKPAFDSEMTLFLGGTFWVLFLSIQLSKQLHLLKHEL